MSCNWVGVIAWGAPRASTDVHDEQEHLVVRVMQTQLVIVR